MSARAALAFNELKRKPYSKYISQVESAFVRNFNLLLTKDYLLDGIYINKDFEVIPFKYSKLNVNDIRALLKQHGEDYMLEHFGERALNVVKK